MLYGSDVFFAGDGVEKLEVDDVELLKLLDQFDDVSIGQSDARFCLLCELELLLQFQQFIVHFPITVLRLETGGGFCLGSLPSLFSVLSFDVSTRLIHPFRKGLRTGFWAPL